VSRIGIHVNVLEQSAQAFDHYRGHLFAIAYRMLGSATDAEDMVQEAFVR
jgi:RNA polymerase sigma-70 factor, ECF subfamily